MKAVIFDMDGTILNTIDDIAGAVNYILRKYHMPARTVEEVKYFVGNGLRRTLLLSVPKGTPESFVEDIFEEFVSYYKNHSNICTRPYEGIVEAIKTLKEKGYKLAVVSNKRQEAVERLCQIFYKDLFDAIAGDRDGINRKPDPDMVYDVLERIGVRKEDALYIGDSDVDIKTAQNAGLGGIFVSWGFRGGEFLQEQGAEFIADSPEELVKMIVELLGI